PPGRGSVQPVSAPERAAPGRLTAPASGVRIKSPPHSAGEDTPRQAARLSPAATGWYCRAQPEKTPRRGRRRSPSRRRRGRQFSPARRRRPAAGRRAGRTSFSCGQPFWRQGVNLAAPLALLRLAFGTLAVELGDLSAIRSKQLQAGNVSVRRRLARYPRLGDSLLQQMQ